MHGLAREIRTALRSLARSPSFTLAALACLAVGLGAAVALFAVAHAVVLSPLPFDQPDELVVVLRDLLGDAGGRGRFSAAEYLDLTRTSAFATADAMTSTEVSWTGQGQPERLVAAMATPGLLSTLGIEPPLGRSFTIEEGRPGRDGVAILSHGLWQRRFDGSPEALGSTVRLDGRPFTVVGVLPERADFELEDVAHDLWLPLPIDPAAPGPRRLRGLAVVARLAPGVSPAAARAELSTLRERWWQDHPGDYADEEWRMSVTPLYEELVGDSRKALLAAFGVSALVLLIACANVAHLVLARSLARQRETALRSALGATTCTIIRSPSLSGTRGRLLSWDSTLYSLPATATTIATIGTTTTTEGRARAHRLHELATIEIVSLGRDLRGRDRVGPLDQHRTSWRFGSPSISRESPTGSRGPPPRRAGRRARARR